MRRSTAASPESIAASLAGSERMLLFCLASRTDWHKAGVRPATAQAMLIRGLIERESGTAYQLTDQGRAVLDALIAPRESGQ